MVSISQTSNSAMSTVPITQNTLSRPNDAARASSPRPPNLTPAVAATYLALPPLQDATEVLSTRPSSANLLPAAELPDSPPRAPSAASNFTADSHASHTTQTTQVSNLALVANPLASTLSSLATTIESMRGQDTPAAHATMGSLSSTMTALATAITSLHDMQPPTPSSTGSGQAQSQQGMPGQNQNQNQNQSQQGGENAYRHPYACPPTGQMGRDSRDRLPYYDDRFSSQESFEHPFRAVSVESEPRQERHERTDRDERGADRDAIEELRAEQAKLRALVEGSRVSPPRGGGPPQRSHPLFPIPAPPSPGARRGAISQGQAQSPAQAHTPPPAQPQPQRSDKGPAAPSTPEDGARNPTSPAAPVPLATQHQLFAQAMASLLDALDTLGAELHVARRTAIEREAAFGREVTRFFHELDGAHLSAQRIEFLCTFGKRCLLSQLASTTAGTAALEGVLSQHEGAREQASRLTDIAGGLGRTRTALEAGASAAADRAAALALENRRAQGERDRLGAERDRLVAQLQAVHATAGEHDRAVSAERAGREARVAELKKEVAGLADTLGASVEVLDGIRQKGAGAGAWRAVEDIRGQLRWARDKVVRNREREGAGGQSMCARLALVAPQAGADTLKGRRVRAPARLPLDTVDE